jgi:hypothetical protein
MSGCLNVETVADDSQLAGARWAPVTARLPPGGVQRMLLCSHVQDEIGQK